MMKNRWIKTVLVLTLGLVGLAGCNPNNKTDTPAEQTARDTRDNTAHAADRAGDRTAEAANNAGDAIKNAGNSLEKNADELATTAKVKNALMTTKQQLEWNNINVDTDKGVVHLKGAVPNAQQKAVAEKIAKQTAGNKYMVKNELQVNKGVH
jgi:osmotically-inducible protein OsmY